MTGLVKDHIIGLQIAENDVLLVQVLERKNDLGRVHPGDVNLETPLICKSHAHIATWCIVHDKIESA